MAAAPNPNDPNANKVEPVAPEAPPAPAGLPPQAQAPEPSPSKASAEEDDEKDQQQQVNPMDLLKPKKDKKDETQRAAGDHMKLVDALNDTVADINNRVTDATKELGNKISEKIDQGIQAIRGVMESDMGNVSPAPSSAQSSQTSGPQTSMGPAADTNTNTDPKEAVQVDMDNVATPTPTTPTPSAPDIQPDGPKLGS